MLKTVLSWDIKKEEIKVRQGCTGKEDRKGLKMRHCWKIWNRGGECGTLPERELDRFSHEPCGWVFSPLRTNITIGIVSKTSYKCNVILVELRNCRSRSEVDLMPASWSHLEMHLQLWKKEGKLAAKWFYPGKGNSILKNITNSNKFFFLCKQKNAVRVI